VAADVSALKTRRSRVEKLTWIAIIWLASLGVFLQEAEWAPFVADDTEF
jgi:hypothetical protein